jgi:type IV pilus assembly protein PilA
MRIKRNGFTLVELLAVIVVLGIILVIAIPNVLGIIDNARKDSFLSTAKMMASQARTKVSTEAKYYPSSGSVKSILLTELNLDNVSKDVDGGVYGANSYVYVANNAGVIKFYVTLQGSKRAINAIEESAIGAATPGATSTAVAKITTGTVELGGVTYNFEAIP